MSGDIRARLAEMRSILDDIDRDLPPRALKCQEDLDAIVEIVNRECDGRVECEECAFWIPGDERCTAGMIQDLLARARGGRSQ